MTDREAMKLALEALKASHPISNTDKSLDKHSEAMFALRQALEQPEQEPVAWWNPRYGKGEYAFAEEQSPPDDSNDPSDFGWNIPLYIAPPKHEWVGLTDDEIVKASIGHVEGEHMLPHSFARAIEKLLREKNT